MRSARWQKTFWQRKSSDFFPMSAIRQLLNRVKTEGARRSGTVTTVSMGRERTFEAFDIGDDTFVLEKGVVGHLGERPSVLLVEKRQLRRRTKGR